MDAAAATRRVADAPELSPAPARPGLRALSHLKYLRDLAALVALGTTGAALADYAFRAQAVSYAGRRRWRCCSFFAVYYAGVSLVTFVVQAALSRLSLERLGLGANAGTPSAALLARRPRRDRRARPAEHRRGARRRVGVPRIAVPRQLRDLLHADGGGASGAPPSRSSTSGSIGWAMRLAPRPSGSCCCSWRRRSSSRRSSGWRWRRRQWRSC